MFIIIYFDDLSNNKKMFQDYFSDCTETIIKENYVVVYEVLV